MIQRVSAFTFVASSGLLAVALPAQRPFSTHSLAAAECPILPCAEEIYYGVDVKPNKCPTGLRISNGGAGLSGLVGELANHFITYYKSINSTCFKIEWVKGDTTESINYLATGQADVGITYSKAAECQAEEEKWTDYRQYGFRDHFYLVGPGPSNENPAGLQAYDGTSGAKNENVMSQFRKIVRTGNEYNNPPTRFLSRYDKSATNIKDSELFIAIGQVPWAFAYSKWYHQYMMYPIDALKAASLLKEYTVTDRGTWLSTPEKYTKQLVIYNEGNDENPQDPLLNPAFFLIGTKASDRKLAKDFVDWVTSFNGQSVIENFKGKLGGDSGESLYTGAPPKGDTRYDRIRSCEVPGA